MRRIITEEYGEHYHTHNGVTYFVKDLWEQVSGLPEEMVEIAQFMNDCAWDTNLPMPMRDFCKHMKRIQEADLSYPIILHPEGHIMDGYHRLCKAYMLGHTHIAAKRWA